MSTPEKWLDAAALPYPDHASFLDGHTLSADLVMKQAQMALSLRDELAEWKDKLGAMTAAHRYATDELAECRAKLAAQIERCGLAELAVAQRDIPLAAAQAENVRLREMAGDYATAMCSGHLTEDEVLAESDAFKAALATPTRTGAEGEDRSGSRAALREMLAEAVDAAWEGGMGWPLVVGEFSSAPRRAAIISRLLPDEGGQS